MPDVRLPLSGNVTQTIDPWKWVLNPVDSQLGLINVNLGHSSNPEIEKQILGDVGTYGKQLGRIGDVLCILLKHVKLDGLTSEEKFAVEELQHQLRAVEKIKRRHQPQEQTSNHAPKPEKNEKVKPQRTSAATDS